MIEVTDEMLKVARSMQSFELMIKRIIELHEQSNPKPKPVAWAMCEFEHIFETREIAEKYRKDFGMNNELITPIYTTPPARDPLSEDEIRRLWKNGTNVETIVEFARLIEKAHGIGVE